MILGISVFENEATVDAKFKKGSKMQLVDISEVAYCTSIIGFDQEFKKIYKDHVKVVLVNGKSYLKKVSLKKLLEINSFVRANKFEIFNLNNVAYLSKPNVIYLSDNLKIRISRNYRDELMLKFKSFYI